jgi:amino acid transporter
MSTRAFLTAELSTMLPHNGGFVWWVNEAFGPYWAFQEAYWSFINNFFDLSIYPVMFETYISQVLDNFYVFQIIHHCFISQKYSNIVYGVHQIEVL